jgi:hypothetical protein
MFKKFTLTLEGRPHVVKITKRKNCKQIILKFNFKDSDPAARGRKKKPERDCKGRRQYFVRKEAQVQWQTSKIPFITGGPGPAENARTASEAASHNL